MFELYKNTYTNSFIIVHWHSIDFSGRRIGEVTEEWKTGSNSNISIDIGSTIEESEIGNPAALYYWIKV